jgi:dipeptidyl aminopeptidase/acylaminoacyl peptidase
MANIPKKEGQLPVAILLRGWVDEKEYYTGKGSDKMAEFLAKNGFITLAPDFLGYGGSASAFPDMLQTRFFRPITVISLLESLDGLPKANQGRVVIWSHSNGGQIALSVLEITGKDIPTSLWAPVSAPFPESILHYVDELEDKGEMVRKVINEFEEDCDSIDYSITNFFNQINAPLIIHQGTDDEAIPLEWTENLVKELENLDIDITYFQYQGENHNFHYGGAPIARNRDLNFFKKSLEI